VTEIAEFELWQDDMRVAGVSGPRVMAWRDILHYTLIYGQDGPVRVCEIVRKPVGQRIRRVRVWVPLDAVAALPKGVAP
jgi:hypothetical protein